MTRFNENNTGYESKYPLFLGDDQGLFDTIHRNYPELEELYQQQLAQLWNEFEVDLTQDQMDMKELDRGTVDLMRKTVSWQWLADSVAGRSISGTLAPFITNSELEGLVNLWSFFETIHARTYSHIVKQTFTDPTEAMKETYANMEVIQRSESIIKAFDRIEALDKDATKEEKQDAIILAFTALFALEAIAFMASFATTFAIGERGYFQGITQLVKLVARDEKLHVRMDYSILNILKKDPEWQEAIARNQGEILLILDEVVSNELSWADYVFSEGRQVVGLTADLLKQYVRYMAEPVYSALGARVMFEVPKTNPLPYMDNYLDGSKVQSAAQEIQLTSYNVGALEDDTHNLSFDDF